MRYEPKRPLHPEWNEGDWAVRRFVLGEDARTAFRNCRRLLPGEGTPRTTPRPRPGSRPRDGVGFYVRQGSLLLLLKSRGVGLAAAHKTGFLHPSQARPVPGGSAVGLEEAEEPFWIAVWEALRAHPA